MFYRYNPPETEIRYGNYCFKYPTIKHCSGILVRASVPQYKYSLTWIAGDAHAPGRSEFKSAESLFKGLAEYSFDSLEIDPELVIELHVAGFPFELVQIPNPYNKHSGKN